uniref:Non-structural protein NS2 n=1 Tax=Chuzan virus TaxID=77204 RepID=A0A4D6K3A4_9REOV|nr:non-structural protein 2 [Chuzan virus]
MGDRKRYTKTVCVYDPQNATFCSRGANAGEIYYQVKIGRTTQITRTNAPNPKAYVVEIQRPCSLRLLDGNDIISLIISEEGIEVTTERWEEWLFEALTPIPMVISLHIKGQKTEAEIKYCKASGVIAPYTPNGVDRRVTPQLPGITFTDVSVRDFRQKMREEREKEKERTPMITPIKPKSEAPMMGPSTSHQYQKEESIAVGKISDYVKKVTLESNVERDSDDEDEHGSNSDSDFDGEPKDEGYITQNYMNMIETVKMKVPGVAGLTLKIPKAAGKTDGMIAAKKCKWISVPLFNIDKDGLSYDFVAVGDANGFLCLRDGLSYLVLPVSGSVH